MNIFEHRDSFFGRPDAEITDGSLMSAFHLAKQIRLRLGKQGYLLDGYISLFLEGVTSTLAFDAADDGYLTGGEFQTLLFSLIDGTDAKKTIRFTHVCGKPTRNVRVNCVFRNATPRMKGTPSRCPLGAPSCWEIIGQIIKTADFGRSHLSPCPRSAPGRWWISPYGRATRGLVYAR